MTPEECRRVADAAEKYNVSMLKITSSMRLALIGVAPENVHDAWAATGMQAGAAKGPCIRSIRACPGTEYCRLAKQDALKLGMELDARYHGMSLPAKLKIAVSGCVNQCAENCIRDIGLHGKNDGWVITIGGNGGASRSLAHPFASGLDDAVALLTVDKLIKFYSEKAKKFDRMSKLIKRTGIENIKKAIDLRD
jgi:NAD(P)H-nitrite reductase large subunit